MKKLRLYLNLNAAFSLISGLAMIAFNGGLMELFALNNPLIFPVIGINLLIFAAFVYYVSSKQSKNKALVYLISIMDGLWVLGSIGILLFTPFGIAQSGQFVIGIVAIWIGFLGLMQTRSFSL